MCVSIIDACVVVLCGNTRNQSNTCQHPHPRPWCGRNTQDKHIRNKHTPKYGDVDKLTQTTGGTLHGHCNTDQLLCIGSLTDVVDCKTHVGPIHKRTIEYCNILTTNLVVPTYAISLFNPVNMSQHVRLKHYIGRR